MFGKPEWFVPKRFGWGLTPVTWQGWLYTLIWCAVIAIPFNALLFTAGWPEAMIWMAAGIGGLCADVYLILKAMKGEPDEKDDGIVFTADNKPDRNERLKTNRLEMHITDERR